MSATLTRPTFYVVYHGIDAEPRGPMTAEAAIAMATIFNVHHRGSGAFAEPIDESDLTIGLDLSPDVGRLALVPAFA